MKQRVKICFKDKPAHIEIYINDERQDKIAYVKCLDDFSNIKLGDEFTAKCKVLRDCYGIGTVIIDEIE